jgi:uncharacterized membrane protein
MLFNTAITGEKYHLENNCKQRKLFGEEPYMTCPICEQYLEIVEKFMDDYEDPSNSIKYAICRDCRKQWKLKSAVEEQSGKMPPPKNSQRRKDSEDGRRDSEGTKKRESDGARRRDSEGTRRTDSAKGGDSEGARRNSEGGKKESDGARRRQRDDDGLIVGDSPVNPAKSRGGDDREGIPRKRKQNPSHSNKEQSKRNQRGNPSNRQEARNIPKPQAKAILYDDYDNYDESEEAKGLFKPVRIILGILSIIASLYLMFQGVETFLDNVRRQAESSTAVPIIALGIFCLIAGIFLLITFKRDGIIPFVVPALLYLIGGVIAFFFREGQTLLLSTSIITLIVAIILIILVLVGRLKEVDE